MGAAASMALNEKLSENDMQKICGEQYDPKLFQSLKATDNHVEREMFLSAISDGEEREVFHLFVEFCPDGEMDLSGFLDFCRDTRLLNKQFPSSEAEAIFQKYKSKQGSGVTSINYNTLRNHMLPAVAKGKEMDISELIERLSKCEGPLRVSTKVNVSGASSPAPSSPMKEDLVRSGKEISAKVSEEVASAAAVKLQSAQRKKAAMEHVASLRDIRQSSTADLNDIPSYNAEDPVEIASEKTFLKFCPTGEMDSRIFLKMMKDIKLIDKNFTSHDADLLFQKTKAKVSSPTAGVYTSGLVHGKRIRYQVFRAITIPAIAEKKRLEPEDIVQYVANATGPVISNGAAVDSVKLGEI